jgi:hypothetical protein
MSDQPVVKRLHSEDLIAEAPSRADQSPAEVNPLEMPIFDTEPKIPSFDLTAEVLAAAKIGGKQGPPTHSGAAPNNAPHPVQIVGSGFFLLPYLG